MTASVATQIGLVAGAVRRLLLTRSRVAISLVLTGLLGLASFAANVNDAPARAITDIVLGGVLLLALPLITLVFAVAALGELRDDETLVYLWLKPIPRPALALGAAIGAWSAAVPLAVVVGAGVALAGGREDLLLPVLVAGTLASMAYASIFLALGLRTTRSLLVGLLLVLLWEGFFAQLSAGVASWTVRRWASGIFANLSGAESSLEDVGTFQAVGVLSAVIVAGVALTARWLQTRDVP